MIDHLRYAAHLEPYARHAASHRLHDGIRQILRQGRKHEDIGSIVNIRDALVITHITERNDWERKLAFELLAVSTQYCHAGVLPHLGMLLSHQPARLYQIIHALIGIGGSLGDEEDDALVLRQLRAQTGFQLILRTIYMGIYRIGNRLDAMTARSPLNRASAASHLLQVTKERAPLLYTFCFFFHILADRSFFPPFPGRYLQLPQPLL